jgi:hypothetical protein
MRRLFAWLTVAAVCAALAVAALRFGSYVAGGSDSYCYVHQAERWARGRLLEPEPLALEAPWPDAPLTFAPAGHVPSRTVRGAIVPICPAGLSLLMAPALAAGGRTAMFAVVPLCGLLLIVATWLLGRGVGERAGLAAAAVTAASPIVLNQVIQPMSDVPAAAFWTLALALALRSAGPSSVAAGVAGGVAILIRPNLVPLGFVVGGYLLLRPGTPWRERLRHAARYAIGCAAACLAVAAIQQHFYGSPLASGYGSISELFSLDRAGLNASRYASWLARSHGPLLALAAVAPFVLARPLAAVGLTFVLVNVAVYLPYLTFDDWSYVRFLLPSVPILAVLGMGTVSRLAGRIGERAVPVALAVSVLVLAVLGLREADRRQAFRLAELESVFARTGRVVGMRLPPNALVVTSRFSGSVRFYGSRPTLVWDVLDPAWLDRAVAFARARGLEPYILLDSGEEAAFRQRFAGSDLARLDWPPLLEIAPQVRLYQPAARARYLAGETSATEYVR